jgi:glucose-6-phosphate dehydrogenase assembly protein OpcA
VEPGDARGGGGRLRAGARPGPGHLAAGGGKLLCSEEITLLARGRGGEHLPALVSALLVPDVPTALFWSGGRPSEALKWRRLVEGSERLIVDTGRLAATAELRALAQVARLSPEVELADLGWLRLAPFRVLMASLFDPPVGAEPLRRAARLRLVCANDGGATARLLLGWLASRLDWGQPRRADAGWLVPREGGQVRLEIETREIDAGADGIYTVELAGERGEVFSLSDAGPHTVEARAAGLPTRHLSAPERSDAELLVAALGARGHDPLFGAALERAAALEAAS